MVEGSYQTIGYKLFYGITCGDSKDLTVQESIDSVNLLTDGGKLLLVSQVESSISNRV